MSCIEIYLFNIVIICTTIIIKEKTLKNKILKGISLLGVMLSAAILLAMTDVKTYEINQHEVITKAEAMANGYMPLETSTEKILQEPLPLPEDNKSQNPFMISGLTAKQIDEKLAGTFMEGAGEVCHKAEQEYGVNFRLIYAVAALESGRGKNLANTHNYFGVKNWNNQTGWKAYTSKDEAIIDAAIRFSSDFYYGRTIESIATDYCPSTTLHPNQDVNWAINVKKIMLEV